jgi:hypothetical protein
MSNFVRITWVCDECGNQRIVHANIEEGEIVPENSAWSPDGWGMRNSIKSPRDLCSACLEKWDKKYRDENPDAVWRA